MPFKSEAQHRKFRILLAQGKIDKKTFNKWMRETKAKYGKKHPIKPLPEKVEKTATVDKEAKVLTTAGRERIKEKNFALPEKDAYPIHDLTHARNALARVSAYGSPEEKSRVRAKVYSKYPGLKKRYEEREGESPISKKSFLQTKISAIDIIKEAGKCKKKNAKKVKPPILSSSSGSSA